MAEQGIWPIELIRGYFPSDAAGHGSLPLTDTPRSSSERVEIVLLGRPPTVFLFPISAEVLEMHILSK
jgi:hypothetical protein